MNANMPTNEIAVFATNYKRCIVIINGTFQNHPQRYERLICFHSYTATTNEKICWLERDLNLHLRVSRPPLYPLSGGSSVKMKTNYGTALD